MQNLDAVDKQAEANTMTIISVVQVMGVALLIFTILLFLPILIKIEENTRYVQLSKKNEEKE